MAKRTLEFLVDDLDGTVLEQGAGEVVRFALDGKSYSVDLSTEHAAELRAALQPYISAGRRDGRGTGSRGQSSKAPSRAAELAAIRKWARGAGHTVSDRGRIPEAIIAAYDAAH